MILCIDLIPIAKMRMTLSSSFTAVFLKFDALHSFENYLRSVYSNAYPLILYLQMQFIKFENFYKLILKCNC